MDFKLSDCIELDVDLSGLRFFLSIARSHLDVKKKLTWCGLMWFGVGVVVGAGIFVFTGFTTPGISAGDLTINRCNQPSSLLLLLISVVPTADIQNFIFERCANNEISSWQTSLLSLHLQSTLMGPQRVYFDSLVSRSRNYAVRAKVISKKSSKVFTRLFNCPLSCLKRIQQ